MKKSTMIILGILITAFVFIGLFIWFIAYSSTTDVSNDAPFKEYLNKPLVVKETFALIRGDENLNRFSSNYIDVSSEEAFIKDKAILKEYRIGDTIVFTSAKKYFSNHVGNSYYLLGSETLDTGEIIEFQYGTSFEYMPAMWETLEEFLERRKLNKDFP